MERVWVLLGIIGNRAQQGVGVVNGPSCQILLTIFERNLSFCPILGTSLPHFYTVRAIAHHGAQVLLAAGLRVIFQSGLARLCQKSSQFLHVLQLPHLPSIKEFNHLKKWQQYKSNCPFQCCQKAGQRRKTSKPLAHCRPQHNGILSLWDLTSSLTHEEYVASTLSPL